MTNWPPPRLRFAKSWPNRSRQAGCTRCGLQKESCRTKGNSFPFIRQDFFVCHPSCRVVFVMILRIVLPVRPPASARCWERRPLRSDAHRLGDLIFRQAFPPRRGAGSVGRYALIPTDWATRFSVRPSTPARCCGRWSLRPAAYRLGDPIFRQAVRLGGVLGVSTVAPRRPPIGRPDFLSGFPPRRGVGGVGRCALTLTDWAT